MFVNEAIAMTLGELGIERVYGLVGDANLYMMDAFRARGGRFVAVAHEASSLLAAAGDARVSGQVGVASVTHGPGLANSVDSLIEAVKARVPVVLMAGDTAASDDDNFQDIDQAALVAACGALFVGVPTPETAERELRRAFRLAAAERTAVVYDIPIDFQWADAAHEPRPESGAPAPVLEPDSDDIEAAVGVLAAARRPLILAGRGALGARAELLALAERLGAPVAVTAQARQLFRGERFDLGIFGGLATPTGLDVMLQSDCVIAFGAGLNKHTTAERSLVDGRALVHVDIEAASLGRHVTPAVAVRADAGAAARAMLRLLDEAEIPAAVFATPELADRLRSGTEHEAAERRAHRDREREREQRGERPADTVDLHLALWAVEDAFPRPRTLVIDAGRHCITGLGVFSVDDPRHYVHTINFASIGVGMPYAIGAAKAAPHRPTLLVCGDGGFLLGGLTEFHTAVTQRLDLTVVVLDDGSFGAEHVQLVRKGLDPAISKFERPDFAAVAQSLGGTGVTVRSIAELVEALAGLDHGAGPTLLDVLLDPAEISARG